MTKTAIPDCSVNGTEKLTEEICSFGCLDRLGFCMCEN
jgi:hypothetical protein